MSAVTIFKTGEEKVTREFEGEQATLASVLEGVDTSESDVLVNGEDATEGQMVADGDEIVLVGNIEGGL